VNRERARGDRRPQAYADTSPVTAFILITGIPGSGKTTLARALATHLHATLIDRDTLLAPILTRVLTDAGATDGDFTHPLALTLRDPSYQATLDVAFDNHACGQPTLAVAPFTAELTDPTWYDTITATLGHPPTILWVDTPAQTAWDRRRARDTTRDRALLGNALSPPTTDISPVPTVAHLRLTGDNAPDALLAEALTALGYPG
jgi:GTPase SAR1 family protein